MTTHFFLGANSGEGFQSLYPDLADLEKIRDLIVLKGGPGVGKSTFMKQVGRAAEEAGQQVEYIWCSGDPDSLDAVLLPECAAAVVDGTSPHVVEPRYPAAVDRYVNLGQFYDVDALKKRRLEVVTHTEAYKEAYQRAFHCLKAARQVERSAFSRMAQGLDRTRLDRRVSGIIARELRKKGGEEGVTTRRLLGSMTHKGYVWRFDSVDVLCSRVYELADRWELGSGALARLHDAAAAAGWNTIVCPNPEDLTQIRHLLIPGLGLAFVTSGDDCAYPGKPNRRLRLDAMTTSGDRARVRFARRMTETLREEALAALREAKSSHDALEAVYHPHVDFDGVAALAREETNRILGYVK